MYEGLAPIVVSAVVGAVLGNFSAHEHFRRARMRSILALLALISAIVLVGGSSTLAVAVLGGAILGMVVEMFMGPDAVDEPTHEDDGAGAASRP